MNRKVFFDKIKGELFKGSFSQTQVKGIDALLDVFENYKVYDVDHMAYIMANVFHETGGYMLGIKETVMPHHKDKNPSDKMVISRLDKAFKAGKLPWVKKPYWQDGAFGRGAIQLTHWPMYEKVGRILGYDLRNKPDLALDPYIGAEIAAVGMTEGVFTGKKLGDYIFPDAVTAPVKSNPRRIVNGNDGTDKKVSGLYSAFKTALLAAIDAKEQDIIVVEKPVLVDPEDLGKSPWRSKTSWTWFLSGVGSVAQATLTYLNALDWRVAIAITVITAGFAIYGIKRRDDLFKSIKRIKSELES